MITEKRLLQLDLFKLSVQDLINLLQNKAIEPEQRHQILAELQKRNAGTRCKQFLE